jgi:hypothetical protein
MTEHERNLRDLSAMFALNALASRCSLKTLPDHTVHITRLAYELADEMMKARNPEEEGIAAIRKKRTTKPLD